MRKKPPRRSSTPWNMWIAAITASGLFLLSILLFDPLGGFVIAGTLPVDLHSHLRADYGVDASPDSIQRVNFGVIEQALRDRLDDPELAQSAYGTVVNGLETPVPTATREQFLSLTPPVGMMHPIPFPEEDETGASASEVEEGAIPQDASGESPATETLAENGGLQAASDTQTALQSLTASETATASLAVQATTGTASTTLTDAGTPVPTGTPSPDDTAELTRTPKPTKTPIATETTALTDTPEPTHTVAPTDTPIPADTDPATDAPSETPAPTHTPKPTDPGRATSTAVPTATAEPTDTPVPTDTAVPTDTVAPNNTGVPKSTDDPTAAVDPGNTAIGSGTWVMSTTEPAGSVLFTATLREASPTRAALPSATDPAPATQTMEVEPNPAGTPAEPTPDANLPRSTREVKPHETSTESIKP